MKVIAIYPGRFHPFHKGHASSFKQLAEKFGLDNTYLAISAKQEQPKSPFSAQDRAKMATSLGIPGKNILAVRNPYVAQEYIDQLNLDPEKTAIIFGVSKKDMEGDPAMGIPPDPRFGFKPKKDGSPSYLQPFNPKKIDPMSQHGYIMSTDVAEFPIAGKTMRDASAIRSAYAGADDETKMRILTDLYGDAAEKIKPVFDNNLQITESIRRLVNKIKPMLGEATIQQKAKFVKLLSEAKQLGEYNIRKTKKFIQRAHDKEQGQMYGNMPYSSHPKQVANLGKRFFGTKFGPEAVKVALLHDVLEDTPYTPEQLSKKGFSDEVIEAVQLLTKNKELSYADNIRNIIASGNPLAMMVKYCDNYMNYTGDKSHWAPDRAAASQKKYLASLNMLGDVLGIKKHVGDEEMVSEADGDVYTKGQAGIVQDLGDGYFLGDDSYADDEGFTKEGYTVYKKVGVNSFRMVGSVEMSPYRNEPGAIEREIERLIQQDQNVTEEKKEKSGIEQAYDDPETRSILTYAKQHYPEEPDLQAAFVKFVLKSLKHSKEDDERQDIEIDYVQSKLKRLEKELAPKQVTETQDYLDEK